MLAAVSSFPSKCLAKLKQIIMSRGAQNFCLPISHMLKISNSFLPVAKADTDIPAYFFPHNCREHQVSPMVELTYYHAYWYCDGPLADADVCDAFKMYITGQNK